MERDRQRAKKQRKNRARVMPIDMPTSEFPSPGENARSMSSAMSGTSELWTFRSSDASAAPKSRDPVVVLPPHHRVFTSRTPDDIERLQSKRAFATASTDEFGTTPQLSSTLVDTLQSEGEETSRSRTSMSGVSSVTGSMDYDAAPRRRRGRGGTLRFGGVSKSTVDSAGASTQRNARHRRVQALRIKAALCVLPLRLWRRWQRSALYATLAACMVPVCDGCKRIVTHVWYDKFIVACIFLNAVGIASDHYGITPTFKLVLDIGEVTFSSIFTLGTISDSRVCVRCFVVGYTPPSVVVQRPNRCAALERRRC
jgi:hypothetical protein